MKTHHQSLIALTPSLVLILNLLSIFTSTCRSHMSKKHKIEHMQLRTFSRIDASPQIAPNQRVKFQKAARTYKYVPQSRSSSYRPDLGRRIRIRVSMSSSSGVQSNRTRLSIGAVNARLRMSMYARMAACHPVIEFASGGISRYMSFNCRARNPG